MNVVIKKIQVYVIGIIYTCVVLWFFLITWQKTEHHNGVSLDFPKRCHMHLINDNNDSLLQVSVLQTQKIYRDNIEDIDVFFIYHTDRVAFETSYISLLELNPYSITQRLFHTFPSTIAETQRLLL